MALDPLLVHWGCICDLKWLRTWYHWGVMRPAQVFTALTRFEGIVRDNNKVAFMIIPHHFCSLAMPVTCYFPHHPSQITVTQVRYLGITFSSSSSPPIVSLPPDPVCYIFIISPKVIFSLVQTTITFHLSSNWVSFQFGFPDSTAAKVMFLKCKVILSYYVENLSMGPYKNFGDLAQPLYPASSFLTSVSPTTLILNHILHTLCKQLHCFLFLVFSPIILRSHILGPSVFVLGLGQ